jgi:hypothetical protein
VYDFLTATVIEGLNALANERPIELITTQKSNYARTDQVWSRRRILREGGSRFDVVILGTNEGVDRRLFEAVAKPNRSVCIDGSDTAVFEHAPTKFALYFKRELPVGAIDVPPNVLPCPFGIEQRFWHEADGPRPIFFSACFAPRGGERAETLAFVTRLGMTDAQLGEIKAPPFRRIDGIRRGQCRFWVSLRRSFAVGHNERYAMKLRSSVLSLSIPGAGWDTGRFWEILGSGAILVSRQPAIQMPAPLVPHEHFLPYADLEDLARVISNARARPAQLDEIRRSARSHAAAHHTTRARARYIVDEIAKRILGQPNA